MGSALPYHGWASMLMHVDLAELEEPEEGRIAHHHDRIAYMIKPKAEHQWFNWARPYRSCRQACLACLSPATACCLQAPAA